MIALDVASNGTSTGTTPLTWSHTCSGIQRVLIVGVVVDGTGSTLSTPTYNGVAMTIIGSQQQYFSANCIAALYFMINPPTGSNTISITFGGTTPTCNAAAVSWTGVNQASQPDASAVNTGATSANPSLTVTSVADNCWTVGICGDRQTTTAGLTNRWSGTVGSSKGTFEDSNGAVHPGAQTVNWTATSSWWGAVAASFAPAIVDKFENYGRYIQVGNGMSRSEGAF